MGSADAGGRLFGGLLLQASGVAASGSYTADLLRSVLALAAVCLLAWVALRFLSARGGLSGLALGGAKVPVRVLGRVALEPRRSLYVVRAGSRVLLVGVGDGAAPNLVAELDPSEFTSDERVAGGHAASAVTGGGDDDAPS